jgi:hypothetical protein
MRSILRFFVLGAVAFGGLLGGIQPAHADDDLQAGPYYGIVTMAIHSQASQNVGDFSGSASISWIGEGNLDLTITDAKNGTADISYLPLDIFDFAYADLPASCFVSIGIKAKGLFHGLPVLGTTNFNPEQKVGEVPLIYTGLLAREILYETAEGCNSMADAQMIAVEQTSTQITQIRLTVTIVDDVFISGKCSLPDWEGGGSIPNGSYIHVVDSCYWWAMKAEEGAGEWKDK